MRSDRLYSGEIGTRYHERRMASRSYEGQLTRAKLFADVTNNHDIVLDFGCGTGTVLASLRAARRIGVEINELAAGEARAKLDLVVDDISAIAGESVDVVISNHALEHVEEPASIIRNIWRVLKPGGAVRIVVPGEMPILLDHHRCWKADDPDMHLFCWSPLTLGNLLAVSGFAVEAASLIPDSEGGRLGRLFRDGTRGRRAASFLKALRTGRFHTSATARKLILS